jgi:hypothetical protein
VFLPAPLIALGACTIASTTVLAGLGELAVLMLDTAFMVPVADFLTGVLSALAIYAVVKRLSAARRSSPSTLEVSASNAT